MSPLHDLVRTPLSDLSASVANYQLSKIIIANVRRSQQVCKGHYPVDAEASLALRSLRRTTSQLYSRAVLTSITVICSRKNSRSS